MTPRGRNVVTNHGYIVLDCTPKMRQEETLHFAVRSSKVQKRRRNGRYTLEFQQYAVERMKVSANISVLVRREPSRSSDVHWPLQRRPWDLITRRGHTSKQSGNLVAGQGRRYESWAAVPSYSFVEIFFRLQRFFRRSRGRLRSHIIFVFGCGKSCWKNKSFY